MMSWPAVTKFGMQRYRLIDLFCGCGGLTKGFIDTGRFEVVFANDNNEESIRTYKANFDCTGKHTFLGNIEKVVDDPDFRIPKADVVIGGPPCQGFSLLNKQRGVHDGRRQLWYQFLRVAEVSRAKMIVMENVPQLLDSPEFGSIVERLQELGFKYLMADVLHAANYGAPQDRRRAIIMASMVKPVALPIPTRLKPEKLEKNPDYSKQLHLKRWVTVREAIYDLPKPKGVEIRNEPAPLNLHFGRQPTPESVERYKAVPPGGNRFDLLRNRPDITPDCWKRKKSGGTDLFGRLWWDRPSVTIRTEFFKPEKGRYLHPEQDRPITHREAARIQSFPDDFIFCGSKLEIARQIGNAVPVLLARAVGEAVAAALDGRVSAKVAKEVRHVYARLLGSEVIDYRSVKEYA